MGALSFRQRKILFAVISEYVESGEPVSSQKIASLQGVNLSSATIRAELAGLEQAGFLRQPHTSAGRIPTAQGFRIFVDALRKMQSLGDAERDHVIHNLYSIKRDSENVIRETGKFLAQITQAATVVTTPKSGDEPLLELRIVVLPQGRTLLIMVTLAGSVQDFIVEPIGLSQKELEDIHNYLATCVRGKTLSQLQAFVLEQMQQETSDYSYAQRALSILNAAMEASAHSEAIVIEGQEQLFARPEFQDVEKVKAFLRAFEAKKKLLNIIDQALQPGSHGVLIGNETSLEGTDDISVISAEYDTGHATGTVSVLGPTRIDYGRVVPLVELTAHVMSDVLQDKK